MSAARARRRTIAALAVGVTLGAAASAGTALLLYTGQGFLRAAGLLVSSTLMAVAAGLWAGAPEASAPRPVATRLRWLSLAAALLAGGIFAGWWITRAPLREQAFGGALAVLLVLALPAYAAGSLLAGLHARDGQPRNAAGAVASAAVGGGALGVLLAATVLIQTLEAYGIYTGAAVLIMFVSLLDRAESAGGESHMNDRVVIVTGAGRRGQLGVTLARRFLEAGARVVISARSDALDEIAGELAAFGEVLAVRADLASDDDAAALVATTSARFGRIDALINTAGGLSVMASVEHTSPAEWQREIERNAGTVLRLTRAALPLLRASGGAVVNFASPAAASAPANLAAYSAAKAAVVALTRALAVEEKDHGVRVNAVAPGMMDTDENRAGAATDAVFVTRDDVASVVLFLAGPGDEGITGETVRVLGPTID